MFVRSLPVCCNTDAFCCGNQSEEDTKVSVSLLNKCLPFFTDIDDLNFALPLAVTLIKRINILYSKMAANKLFFCLHVN